MSDVSMPAKPLLNPVLNLRKTPSRDDAPLGGKKLKDIVESRLEGQRKILSEQIASIRGARDDRTSFAGHRLLVAEMFADSFAVSKTPGNLFTGTSGNLIRGAANDGYLIDAHKKEYDGLERRILDSQAISVRCDISRVKEIRAFGPVDIFRGRSIVELWEDAPRLESGRAFHIWLAPFREPEPRAKLLERLEELHGTNALIPTAPRIIVGSAPAGAFVLPDLSDRQNSLAILQREYRTSGHARSVVEIASMEALQVVAASGSVFRIEPVHPIGVTAPGVGEEPGHLPAFIGTQPVVGLVDGGCTATRYSSAEAWREQPFINSAFADTKHGNQVASVVVHGHEWNNNLPLPQLFCRVGVAQAIARNDAYVPHNPARLISYIDAAMSRHPETRVWNLSWNERVSADPIYVSALGHDLSILARKHNALFVIAAGNVSGTQGDRIAPPADCEAALVVGGRQLNADGSPGGPCPQTLSGFGPEFQLVPQVTSYSPLRLLGGGVRLGTSFPTGLISALAAHTFENLREPTPDMVRALIINRTDLNGYDPRLGWGTPSSDDMPWHCAPGTVTLAISANLKAGILYHWDDIPIPKELIRNGKLCGSVSLTSVHRPLCNSEGGPSYIASRVAAAVQYRNNRNEIDQLVGSKELEDTPEMTARSEEFKWQPLRREYRDFSKRGGIGFTGNSFRLYARLYARNIQQFGYRVNSDIPEVEASFVVTFSDGTRSPGLFNTMTASLGNFVESAVINQDIDVDHLGD